MFAEQHIELRENNGRVEFYCKACGISEEAPPGLSIDGYHNRSESFRHAHSACANSRGDNQMIADETAV